MFLNKFVFSLMDRLFLTLMPIKLGKGERLEMVVLESRWTTVYPAIFARGLFFLALGAAGGAFGSLCWWLLEAFQNLGRYLQGEWPRWQWWLAVVVPLALVPVVVLLTWFIEEWNRLHNRYIMFTGTTWVARIRFPGTPFLSFGPTVLLEEAKVGSPGEKPGLENPSFMGRVWDAFLWRFRKIAYIYLPTRIFGAADRWEGVEWAYGTLKCLMAIAGRAEEQAGLAATAMAAWHRARLDEAQAAERWFGEAGQAQCVLDAWVRLAPEGPEIDLMDPNLQDPGLRDRRTGQPTEAAPTAAREEAPLAISFPEA